MTVVGFSRRAPVSSLEPSIASNFVSVDLCDDVKSMEMVKAVKERHGPIALLVHAAAVNRNNILLRCDAALDIASVLNTNVTAPLLLTKHVLRHGGLMRLKEHGGGSVIFIGSTVGIYGNAGQIGYAASKGALDAVCKSLGKEYTATTHVRFNVLAPGLIEGPGMGESITDDARKVWLETSCMKRLVRLDDVADGVLCLASSGMINGHTLVVDGGRS